MIQLQNFIDGQYVPAAEFIDGYNPATGEVYCQVPRSSAKEVELAVQASKKAFEGWSQTPAAQRARVLHRLADLIDENLDRLAQAESRDNGKPLQLAKNVDIPRAAANFRFFCRFHCCLFQ